MSIVIYIFLIMSALQISAPKQTALLNAANGRYCGLYCVLAASSSLGDRPDFKSLLSKEYLSAPYGSSTLDLKAALESINIKGHVYSDLSLRDLEAVRSPVIVHVRSSGSGNKFVHWMLFLGFKDGKIRLYDPPKDEVTLSTDEFLGIWGGTGIIVTLPDESDPLPTVIPIDSLTVIVITGFFILIISLCNPAARIAFISIPLIAIIACCCWQVIDSPSFFKDRAGLKIVKSVHFRYDLKEIDFNQFSAIYEDDNTVIIDARTVEQYQMDHIPKAINLPITTTIPSLQKTLPSLPVQKRIIVYCENSNCDWSNDVGNLLFSRGFQDVSVYRGGYQEWSKRNRMLK